MSSNHARIGRGPRRSGQSVSAEILTEFGYLESRLKDGDVLLVADAPDATFGVLLDWLRPRRLVSHETRLGPKIAEQDGAFDGVFAFVNAPGIYENGSSLREWTRVLSSCGVLIVCEAALDGVDNWDRSDRRLLRERIVRRGFEILEERTEAPCVLVANVARDRKAAVAPDEKEFTWI